MPDLSGLRRPAFLGVQTQALTASLKERLQVTIDAGFFLTPDEDRFPTVDVESMFDQGRRIRELERRVEELKKWLLALEEKK